MLKAGQQAPHFELPDADLKAVSSESLFGRKTIVLFFYPKDDTPGCTMEALEFTDLSDQFDACDTIVLGISRDNCVSHADFRDKHGLTVTLLADIDGLMSESYGVWQEKERHGEHRMVIVRSTFVIDRKGVIRHALYDVKPRGHASVILDLVRELET